MRQRPETAADLAVAVDADVLVVGNGAAATRPPLDVAEAIRRRRSNERFRPEAVSRAVLEEMLDLAVLAPNHKLTEPWGFVVLREHAKRGFGKVRARRKVGDRAGEKAAAKRLRIVEDVGSTPVIVAVTCRVKGSRTRREEDYAATWMAIQNLLLIGGAHGLAAKIETGGTIDDEAVRSLLRMPDDDRVVALLFIGVPEKERRPKKRAPARDKDALAEVTRALC